MTDRSFNTYKEHNIQGTKTLFSQVSVVLSIQSLIKLTPAVVVGVKGGIDNLLLAEAKKNRFCFITNPGDLSSHAGDWEI